MDDLHDRYGPEARRAVEAEASLPTTKWDEEIARGLELGLPGANSIIDRRIPTFSRGELPHFAGINTFLKAPYVEDVAAVTSTTWRCSARPSTGHHLPVRNPLRSPRDPQDIRTVRAVQLRARRQLRESINYCRPR